VVERAGEGGSGGVTAAADPVTAYARQVVRGRVPAGRYHRLACERHLRDRKRTRWAYRFDAPAAQRAIAFFPMLKHYKGEWAGQPIRLEPFQAFVIGSVFGWRRRSDGLRRFRTAYVELPRKNGKSTLAAGVSILTTFFDGEAGAEGYCAATKRQQARIVFDDAKTMVRTDPHLKELITVQTTNMHAIESHSKLEPLSRDQDTMDGLNPHFVNIDELHAHKDRGILDVLETAMGARRQPLMFQITTAGNTEDSVCGRQHAYAVSILTEAIADETVFAFIAHADDGDDWTDEATWAKANPNYGVSVKPEDMRALALKAQHMPDAQAEFRQKRLGEWLNAEAVWLNFDGWKRGQGSWTSASLEGRPCWAGVDLSSKIDLSAFVLMFPPEGADRWRVLAWLYMPEDNVHERTQRDRAPYDRWAREGWITTTPGNRIDQSVIRTTILEQKTRFAFDEVGIDPWNAATFPIELEQAGLSVIEVPQNYHQMSEAAKEFAAEVDGARVDASGHPVLTWMASNVVVNRDDKDNIFPVKKKSRGRIDGIVAAIIAMKLALLQDETQQAAQDFAERGLWA